MPAKAITVREGDFTSAPQKSGTPLNGRQTYLLMALATNSFQVLVKGQLRTFKLSPMEWLLLGVVAVEDEAGISPSRLATQLQLSPGRVTTLCGKLIDQRILRQKIARQDHRSRRLFLSAKGRTLLEDVDLAVNTAFGEWLKPIPENYLVFYHRVLATLGAIK